MQRIYKIHLIYLIIIWLLGVALWVWIFFQVVNYYSLGIVKELARLLLEQSTLISIFGVVFLFLIPVGLTFYTIHWLNHRRTRDGE